MSTVGTITKLATQAAGKAAHAALHPRQTVTSVTGHARGLAATVTGGSTSTTAPEEGEEAAESAESAEARGSGEPHEPQVVPAPPQNVEPAEPVVPAEPVEPSTTEPKAASRDAAHQGRGSDPTDDWRDELEDPEDVGINPATGLPNTLQGNDENAGFDPSVAKQVRAESEVLSKAADPEKG